MSDDGANPVSEVAKNDIETAWSRWYLHEEMRQEEISEIRSAFGAGANAVLSALLAPGPWNNHNTLYAAVVLERLSGEIDEFISATLGMKS